MGDRRRRNMTMQMAQYQARIEIEDAELFNVEVELINSFMQSEHHDESSHRGSVTGRSYVQRDKEECHDRIMKDYFIKRPRFPAHDFWIRSGRIVLLLRLANSRAVMTSQPSCLRLWRLTTHGFGMLSSAFLDQTTISTFFGLLFCSIMLSMDGHQNFGTSAKKKLFSQRQEFYRKDMERAFGILQARWDIVRGLARFWKSDDLHSIMMTCIILHNIVEYEYIEIEEDSDEDVDDNQPTHVRDIARDIEYLAPATYET
ncbi:unnamed protein product [Malus baccata var. baccata]